MTIPAAVADKPTVHCFTCRDRRTYTRMLASRPVYSCDGCGSTREIEELGRVELSRSLPGPKSKAPAPQPIRRTYTNRRKETTAMPKNPLQKIIDAATAPLLDRIEQLEKKSAPEMDDEAIKRLVDERLEELAGGATASAATRSSGGAGPKCGGCGQTGHNKRSCGKK